MMFGLKSGSFLEIYGLEYEHRSKHTESCDFYGAAKLAQGAAVTKRQQLCSLPAPVLPPRPQVSTGAHLTCCRDDS